MLGIMNLRVDNQPVVSYEEAKGAMIPNSYGLHSFD